MTGRASRRNNLISYCLQSGSARVLHCLRIRTELAETAENGASPKLLFKTPALNRSVIFKDLMSVDNNLGLGRSMRAGTKIYLPFNEKKPAEGGQTFFFERRNFNDVMSSFIDMSDASKREALASDASILNALDGLPTFAPFLVRDALRLADITADPLYTAIPEEEWQQIQSFIRDRFRQIVAAVEGTSDIEKRDGLNRLLDKLWELSDVPALENLARAFGLPKEGCMQRFYAWKGTLYFCWAFENLQRAILEMGSWLNEWPRLVTAYAPNLQALASNRFQALHADVFKELRSVEMILSEYDRAFNDLFVRGIGPERFVRFLAEAPDKFSECGTGIGLLQHAHEVWDRLTESFPKRYPNAETLEEVVNGISSVLGRAV